MAVMVQILHTISPPTRLALARILREDPGLDDQACHPPGDRQWAWSLRVGDLSQFNDQLNEYLESFTSNEAKAIVDACGEHNALDAWRQLAERGFYMKPTHLN